MIHTHEIKAPPAVKAGGADCFFNNDNFNMSTTPCYALHNPFII